MVSYSVTNLYSLADRYTGWLYRTLFTLIVNPFASGASISGYTTSYCEPSVQPCNAQAIGQVTITFSGLRPAGAIAIIFSAIVVCFKKVPGIVSPGRRLSFQCCQALFSLMRAVQDVKRTVALCHFIFQKKTLMRPVAILTPL